jgi:hypothetical protein
MAAHGRPPPPPLSPCVCMYVWQLALELGTVSVLIVNNCGAVSVPWIAASVAASSVVAEDWSSRVRR